MTNRKIKQSLKFELNEEFIDSLKKMWSRYQSPHSNPVVNHKRALELQKIRTSLND